MIQQNRYEHELYEARRKAWLDANSRRLEYERGLAKSRAEGVARGEIIGQIKAFEQFLNLSATSSDSLEAMSTAELDARYRELQSLWSTRSGSPPPNS